MEKLHETLFILFSSLQLSRLSSTHELLCVTTYNSRKEAVTHVQPQLSFLQRQSDKGRANYDGGGRDIKSGLCFYPQFSPTLTLADGGGGKETVESQ